MAASKVSSARDAERAICRLVEETSGHEIRYFGPGCLVKIENTQFLQSVGTPKSKFFLVASKEVLAKGHLEALKKQEKEKRAREPTVKMKAEFPGLKDKTKLERIALDQLYVSIKDDVFELHGITYVSLTKCREQRIFGKSSLLNRVLDVVSTEDENSSTLLTSDQLKCLVFCGERTSSIVERNVCELSTRVYDLLQVDSVLASDETRFSSFFLRNEEKKRFLREDEFEKDEKPFGSIILNRDYKLAGMLNFVNNNPVPVIVGSGSGTDTGVCSYTHLSHVQRAGVPPKADEKHNVAEKEVHTGASGGIYPLVDSQSKHVVGAEAANKTDMPTLPQPVVTPSTGNQFVTGFGDGDKTEESSGDPDATDPHQLPGVDGKKEVQEKEYPDFPSGKSSPTENSYRSLKLSSSNNTEQDLKGSVDLVDLPPDNDLKCAPPDKVETLANQLRLHIEDQRAPANNSNKVHPVEVNPGDRLQHQTDDQSTPADNNNEVLPVRLPEEQLRRKRNDQWAPTNGILPQDRSRDSPPQGQDIERRHSFSSLPSKREEHLPVKRSSSASPGGQRKLQLDDPLTKTLLDCLGLLEASSRCLDPEYRYGHCRCWKHVAEFFGVPEEEYQNFKCSKVQSPTEVMFEFLKSVSPDTTVGTLKDALAHINRHDVIDILVKHEKSDKSKLNDETLVSSLFDSDPDIIGEMAFLLDKEKFGLKDWSDLAAQLGVARTTFMSFDSCSTDNPTKEFFDILKVRFPGLTVGKLIGHLEAIKRRDVIKAIKASSRVSGHSLIKELMADLDVMDNVCELLNNRQRTPKVLGLKHLGNRFEIEEEILDDLLPAKQETVSPTETLIRHLGGRMPWLKLTDFIWALHTIERNDVLAVLDDYMPDECIPNLLKSCSCKRCCKKSAETN